MANDNTGRRNAARRKLLRILPRNKLEYLSLDESPWQADVPYLIERAVINWDGEEVEKAIKNIFDKANRI